MKRTGGHPLITNCEEGHDGATEPFVCGVNLQIVMTMCRSSSINAARTRRGPFVVVRICTMTRIALDSTCNGPDGRTRRTRGTKIGNVNDKLPCLPLDHQQGVEGMTKRKQLETLRKASRMAANCLNSRWVNILREVPPGGSRFCIRGGKCFQIRNLCTYVIFGFFEMCWHWQLCGTCS